VNDEEEVVDDEEEEVVDDEEEEVLIDFWRQCLEETEVGQEWLRTVLALFIYIYIYTYI